MRRTAIGGAGGALLFLGTLAGASAEPFYGYSGYFGGPAPYYTLDTDVHQSSTRSEGLPGFGTRVYTEGGPFWHWRPFRTVRVDRQRRRRVVLRRRG